MKNKPLVHDVEQGTPEWFAIRAGKPTSSAFSNLITGTGKVSTSMAEYAKGLALELYLNKPDPDAYKGSKNMDRGTALEPLSRADYEMVRQTRVEEVGFITDHLMRWGSSTDGLVGKDGVVEFKNLIAKTFFKLYLDCKKHNVTPPSYIPQLQGELFVTKRKWVDIVFHHPDFKSIIHRHYPDLKYHATLEKQLKLCIAERNVQLKIARS